MAGSERSSLQKSVLLWSAAFAAFLANILPRFPGISGFDSDYQYHEAITGRYSDWHPPIMAWLWSVLHVFGDGNWPLFLLHLSFYWLAFALLTSAFAIIGRTRAAWAVLIVGMLPTFLTINVQISKDVGLAVTLLLSFAIFFWHRVQNKRVPLLVACLTGLLLFYGIMVRSNGIFAAAGLLIYILCPKMRHHPIRLLITYVALISVAVPVSGIFNRDVLDAIPTHPVRSLQVFDITGTAFFSGDASVFGTGNSLTNQHVSECYDPRTWDTVSPGSKCHDVWDTLGTLPDMPDTSTPDGHSWYENSPNPALDGLWLGAISKHPFAYMEHRLAFFNSSISFIVQKHHADRFVLNRTAYGFPLPDLPTSKIWDFLKFNPVMTPVFALVFGLIQMFSILRRSKEKPQDAIEDAAFFLCMSGLVYAAGYLLVGVSSDSRYQLWTMIAIFAAAALCLPEKCALRPLSRMEWIGICLLVATLTATAASRLLKIDALSCSAPADAAIRSANAVLNCGIIELLNS